MSRFEKLIRKWFRLMIRVERELSKPWLRDRWRHDSPSNQLRRGLAESARGEVESLGSFEKYIDEEPKP